MHQAKFSIRHFFLLSRKNNEKETSGKQAGSGGILS